MIHDLCLLVNLKTFKEILMIARYFRFKYYNNKKSLKKISLQKSPVICSFTYSIFEA